MRDRDRRRGVCSARIHRWSGRRCGHAHHLDEETTTIQQYTTSDTPVSVLLADPGARAVLEKYLPQLVSSSSLDVIRNVTLKSIQGYGYTVLTEELFAQVDAELAKVTPTVPWDPPRLTTDESRVEPYTLPDALTLENGRKVTDKAMWFDQRRPELLEMFQSLMFGRAPGRPADQYFEVVGADQTAVGGTATRTAIDIHVSREPRAPTLHFVEYLPRTTTSPVPMLLEIGFTPPVAGEQGAAADNGGIELPDLRPFLDAGIGVGYLCYGDAELDTDDGSRTGVRGFYGAPATKERSPDEWGSVAAWAWSLSRVQDYLETDERVDADRVGLLGISRLAMTVMWAAATDQRFAAVISSSGGKFGAGIMRRNFGASMDTPEYWTSESFHQFVGHEHERPIDGHELAALIAPRPLFLQASKYDHAADPRGEFLGAQAATPVYELLGAKGIRAEAAFPPAQPILNDLGFWMNDAGHGPAPGDWAIFLEFLQKHLLS